MAVEGLYVPLILGVVSVFIGFIGALAGVGGGVLFTPLFLAFTAADINIVRATGLALAMTTSIFSSVRYIRAGITNLNIILFSSFFLTIGAVFGATMGIYLVHQYGQVGAAVTRLALGVLLIVIIVVMSLRRVEWPEAREDRFTKLFDLRGVYFEQSLKREVRYAARNAHIAAVFLFLVGVISGTFGLGGGWALVPVLNLVSGLPLKVAVATSVASIAVGDAAGLWVYYHHAYLLPEMFIAVVPGVVVGATLGAKVALRVKASIVKYAVMGVMLVSGIQLIIRGISSLI